MVRYNQLLLLKSQKMSYRLLGPVIRIGPNQFSISDMEVAREVYGPRTSFEKVGICPIA